MAEQEKMGINEFKTFLLGNFATNENVDTIGKQFSDAKKELEKSLGVDSIPSFYSDAQKYMEVHSISIDSSGKIDTSVINQVSKQLETEVKKQQLANEERKSKENIENINKQEEIDDEKKYEDRLLRIKSVDDSIEKYGGIEKFLKDAPRDKIDQFTSLRKEQQVFDDVDEIIVRKINNPDYEFTSEEQEKLAKSKQGRLFKYNSTSGKFDDSLKAEQYISKLEILKQRMQNKALGNNGIIDLNELNNIKNDEEFSIVFEIKNDEEIQQMINEIQEEYKANQRQNFKQRNSHEQAMPEDVLKTTKGDTIATEEIQENFEIFMQRAMQNVPDFAEEEQSLKDEQSRVEIQTKEGISAEDLLQNLELELMNELDGLQIENTDDKQGIQTEDQPQLELADEEVQNEATEEVQDERQEEVEEDIEEIEEEIPEEQYEAPTFEAEEKTGLAGLFSRIANSRAVKAVTNLFKPKEEQKRLNAPANQRVEDGVRFTDYESNGSLLPATIQTRNFFRNFAINTVEAVTKFAKNISGRGKQDNQVINTPTVIKSEPTKAQTEKTVTQEQQQTLEKTETFNDTNKWAVSNEAIQRQEAINKAQERNNLSHVAAPKQEELQSEEDKSFEEI